MNYTDAIRAAEMYHVLPKDVRTVFNPMDIRELYEFSPLSRQLTDSFDLMSADFICVYPLSTTRIDNAGKQLSKVIPIIGNLKKKGYSVRLIVPNAHANADKEKFVLAQMYQIASDNGIERRELVFTSLIDVPKYEQGVPHEVIRDLFLLSNLFIFPSYSENCPLVLLEAMAGKNILVLNQDFPAFKDFGAENALYFRFSSTVAPEPQFPDGMNKYYEDIATLIISEFNQNSAIRAQTKLRKEFNLDYIAKRQLIPAIEELKNE
jgi:glycosyltransferase involved in cell wall biosynthesis